MRTNLTITCILLTLLCTQANAVTWKRKVLTEKREGGYTAVAIFEEAEDANFLPRMILRKTFSPSDSAALAKTLNSAHQLQSPHELLPMTPTNNPLWPIDRQWTDQDEVEFDNWIHTNAAENMLVGGGIQVDCADFAQTLRWVYAHDHHLPAANTLIGGRGLMGSWQSTDVWDKLPTDPDWKKDQRFKKALKYLLDFSFTHSIHPDLYPVAITPEFVTPGTIYLTLEGDSGHTRTLTNVGASPECSQSPECMIIIWGNEPADERGYITEFVPYYVTQAEGGLLRFRWPEQNGGVWQLRDPKKMRGYSEEQFTWNSGSYVSEIADRLGVWSTPESKMRVVGKSTYQLLVQRQAAVYYGYVMCSLVPCQPNDPLYNVYSTPVRDKALSLSVHNFQSVLKNVDPYSSELADFKRMMEAAPIFSGGPFNVWDFLTGDLVQRLNSDPSADFFARWGETNPNADERVLGLSEVAVNVWYKRSALVADAKELCFPNGDDTPTCNPNDPAVQRLNTARMDQGLRELRKGIQAAYAKASHSTRGEVDEYLQHIPKGPELCGPSHDEQCTLYDYTFGKEDLTAKMTSNADSPYLKRMGF